MADMFNKVPDGTYYFGVPSTHYCSEVTQKRNFYCNWFADCYLECLEHKK